MSTRPDRALIFPIGHYLGAFHPDRDAPAQHYVVRVGWDTPKLPDAPHRDVWLLTHDLTAAEASAGTRDAIARSASDAGIANAHSIIDTLLGLGVLALVRPGTEQAAEFAHSYRLQSLLVGLGNVPDGPDVRGIGLPGLPPLLEVPPSDFEIWQWAHLWPSIWSACEGLAAAASEDGATTRATARSSDVLEPMLGAIRTLIAANAIYLDTAAEHSD